MMLFPSIEAFTIGNWRSAATEARTTNGRKVSEKPYCRLTSSLCLARSFATLVISTRCTVVTCAEMRLLATICSAILVRMVLMGSMRIFAWVDGATGARASRDGAEGVAAGGGGGATAGTGAGPAAG